MAVTVQDCIDGIKWGTDLQNGGRLQPTDLIPFVDAAYKQAWETIVGAYEDYFIKKVTDFALAGGAGLNTYDLSAVADFFKLKGIQRQNGSTTFGAPLPTHEFNEIGQVPELSYRMADNAIYFEPELSCAGTYRLWYIYVPADLTAANNPLAVSSAIVAPVKSFIVDLVSARVVQREEEDPGFFLKLQESMLERISRVAGNRNAGRGKKIADTRRSNRFRFMTRSGYSIP